MLDGGAPTPSASGASGAIDYWVDGTEIGPSKNLWLRTTSSLDINILWLSLFHHDDTHSTEGVFYDNVVVGTERIGCL